MNLNFEISNESVYLPVWPWWLSFVSCYLKVKWSDFVRNLKSKMCILLPVEFFAIDMCPVRLYILQLLKWFKNIYQASNYNLVMKTTIIPLYSSFTCYNLINKSTLYLIIIISTIVAFNSVLWNNEFLSWRIYIAKVTL